MVSVPWGPSALPARVSPASGEDGFACPRLRPFVESWVVLLLQTRGLISPDRHLERWIVHHRAGWLNWLFETLSRVGTLGAIWIAIAFVLAFVWRRWGVLVVTAASVAVSDLAATGLKSVIDVQRPSGRFAEPRTLVPAPHDHSFPSGHAATSFAGATVLSAFAPRWTPAWFLLAVAIGFSRVYVGVHYPLDVVSGAVLGVVTALLLLVASRRRSRAGMRSGR